MACDGGVFAPRWNRVESFEDAVHVLVVDDNLVDRKVIERLLKITPCKVTAVDSGMRALEFMGLDVERESSDFDGLKVDLIITDYCMHGMTGYELLKRINVIVFVAHRLNCIGGVYKTWIDGIVLVVKKLNAKTSEGFEEWEAKLPRT